MFHQLRIRRKAVLTAARRKKYAKCDTLQCTGTWADPTGMNWSMLGWQWHHIWNLCIRTGDSDTPSGVLIIAHPASSWSGGFHSVLSRPVDLLLVFDDSATVQNEMDMDMADMGQNYQVTTPRKKKHTSLVWLHCYPSLTRKSQFSDVTNPSQQGSRQAETGQILWNVAGDALYLAINLSRLVQIRNPSKKKHERIIRILNLNQTDWCKEKPYTWIVSIDKIT